MTYQQPTPPPYPQGPYQPQYPIQPAPPKKSNTLKIILLILAGIVVLCGIGGVLGGNGNKSAKSQATSSAAPAPEPVGDAPAPGAPAAPAPTTAKPAAPGLNTPVRDGKFEFVVTDVQTGVSEVGTNPYLRKTAQGAYTIVSLTVRNIGKSPYGFSPSNQYVFDPQNRKFSNDAAAAMNLQSDTSLYANINPGNSITAQVVFDLPTDSIPDHIVLHDSMFSGGATVSLR